MLRKKGIRKLYAFLMAFCMLITTIAGDTGFVYAAEEIADDIQTISEETVANTREIVTKTVYIGEKINSISDLLQAESVVLYNPSNDVIMTNIASGTRLKGTNASWKEETGDFIVPDDAVQLKISETETAGQYNISDKKESYLTTGSTGGNLSFVNSDNKDECSLWNIEAVNTEDDGIYYIKNAKAIYNETVQAIEYYGTFTTYGHNNDDNAFKFEFYGLTEKEIEVEVDTSGLKTVGTLVASLDELDNAINANKQLVLYYPEGEQLVTSIANGQNLSPVDASASADEIIIPEDAVQLNAEKDKDGNYSFYTENSLYLTSAAEGNGLSFAAAAGAEETNYALWQLEPAEGNGIFLIKNVNAINGTRPQYLEYYRGFTTYGYNENSSKLYQYQLYALELKEVIEPTISNGNYVIYNPASGQALSCEYTGNYNKGVALEKNASGSFDKVLDTEVWKINSKTDGTIIISTYNGNNKLSMDVQYASTPLDKVNDTWTLNKQDNGTYYIENVGRITNGNHSCLEWFSDRGYFSSYHTITDETADLFKMELIPVTEEQIESSKEDEPVREPSIEDGRYFIYSKKAEGVMRYGLTGGSAGVISATPTDTNEADFGENGGTGAAVLTIEWQDSNQTYLIKCGSKYVSVDTTTGRNLYFADSPEKTNTKGSYWIIEKNDEIGGYTLANATAKQNSNAMYLEHYPSIGFCVYSGKSLTDIYAFDFLKADNVKDDDGYLGTKPELGTLPEVGKTYVIYNEMGESVMGSEVPVVDGGKATLGAVVSTKENDKLAVGNGGLIFEISQDDKGYYLIKNNDKYLATNDDEALGLMTLEELEIARNGGDEDKGIEENKSWDEKWELVEIEGGLLMKSASAAWSGSSIYVEYFSGGFAGYTYKAISPEIFTFQFKECEDEYGVGYVVNPKVIFNIKSDANLEVDYPVTFTLDDLGENPSAKALVVFEDNSSKEYVTTLDGYNGTFTVPKEDLVGHTSMTVTINATSKVTDTDVSNYSGTSKVIINDEPLITSVSPAANASTGDNKRPIITFYYANIGEDATATLAIDGNEVKLVKDTVSNSYSYTPTIDMIDGKYTLVATITRKDNKKATKTWSFTVGESDVQVKFGQIHSHTGEYSDGTGNLEDAYEYAMQKAANTDYMIVTDHSNYFDSTSNSVKESIYDAGASSILPAPAGSYPGADASESLNLWQAAKATATYYDKQRSDFVAGYGYEMTWAGGPGHINVFNSKGIVSRNNTELNNKTNNAGMFAFFDLLVDAQDKNATDLGGNITAQFNHPGTTFGFFDSFAGLTEERDDIMNLIEVGNGDGSIGGTAYFPSYEYYDMCLSVGWHVAPTNGQDNHKGLWGDSNTARTVALTEGFTESSIYDAMNQRHIYSTEDQNLTMIFSLDGTLQGGIIENYDKDTVKLSVTLADADKEALGTVYVIGENGKVLNEKDAPVLTDNTADLEIELENTSAYYYIKVIQADGDIAVSAPVWVADVNADKAKVSAVVTNNSETEGKNPVAGTEETLTSVLTNDEDSVITIVSYSILAGETVIDSKTDVNASVAAGETYEISCNWTPETYGTHEIKVTYVITVNGESSNIMVNKNIYVEGTDYNTLYKVSDAKKGEEKEEFTIEGIVTANASGFDKNTAFFDCIYVQDETGGINVFPVSGEFQIGQKVRVHGAVTYYNGEIELTISSDYGGYIEIIEEEISPVAPKQVTTKEAMLDENIGLLMQVSGTVTRIHETSGVIDRIYITDDSGEAACVYINGYIWNSVTEDDTFGTDGIKIEEGDQVTAIGIGSVDVDELNEVEYLHRLRTRDRAEINKVKETEPDDSNQGSTTTPSTPSTPSGGTSYPSSSGSQTTTPSDTTQPEDSNTSNTVTEVKPDGTKVETVTETKEDGTKVETVTETKPDGSVKEAVTETNPDGSSKETVKEINADGSTAESVKEIKADNSSVETKKVTSADNSATLQATIETDTEGNASADAIITTGVSNAGTVAISKDLLEVAASENINSLMVVIAEQTVTSTTPNKVNIVINVSIPSVDNTEVDKIVLSKDGIAAAKTTGKGLRVNITDESKDNYRVTIRPKQLAKIGTSVENLDLSIYTDSATNAASVKKDLTDTVSASSGNGDMTCVVSVAENASAPNVGLKVLIPVTEKTGITANSTVYVYKYNQETGKLEEVGNSQQTVSANGTVLVKAFSGMDYVVSAKKLSGNNVVTIVDNIKVNVAKTSIKAGNNTKVTVSLPDTVTKGSKFGAEKATITYKSNKTNIATVTAKGVIKAKKKGTVTITTTVSLASGQKVTQKKKITIK